jgi:hypothetical protein
LEAVVLTDRCRHRIRIATYWTCTAIIAWEMVAGSMWELLRIEYTRGVLTHLADSFDDRDEGPRA